MSQIKDRLRGVIKNERRALAQAYENLYPGNEDLLLEDALALIRSCEELGHEFENGHCKYCGTNIDGTTIRHVWE